MVPSALGEKRGLEGDGEGTIAGSGVDADMSAAEVGTDSGAAFPFSDFIVRG